MFGRKWKVVEIDFKSGIVTLCCGGDCYRTHEFASGYISVKGIEYAAPPPSEGFWPKSLKWDFR